MNGHTSLPPCYAIVDCDLTLDPELFAQQLIHSGAKLIQLRWKSAPDAEFIRVAKAIIALRNEVQTATVLIINDRIEVAKAAAANGIHLGQDDMSPLEARKLLGNKALIGLSTHNAEQVCAATKLPVSYIGFGPIFESSTKNGHAPVTGVENLREVTKLTTTPIVAIGGVSITNAAKLFSAGASSCAVISDALNARSDLKNYLLRWDAAKLEAGQPNSQ